MESVKVNENENPEHEPEQYQENENEKARLSEIDVIEYNNNKKDGENSNKCYKIILVVIITCFIFSLFFFFNLKTVNIFYEDRTKIDNTKLKLNLNQVNNMTKEVKISQYQKVNVENNTIQNQSINYSQNQVNSNDNINKVNNTENKNYLINNINEVTNTKNESYANDDMKNIDVQNNQIEKDNKTKIGEQQINNETINNITNNNETSNNEQNKNVNKKIGLAFVHDTLFANGIARFITVTANAFMETGKYDIYFITGKPYRKEYSYNPNIKRFIAYDNYTLIKNITKHVNINIVILHNILSNSVIHFYRNLGIKVICIFHGVYMSPLSHGRINSYKSWFKFDLYDSYIFIDSDDYYFYNKLGFKNAIFMPNLYTFEPSQIKNSNLTYNNIIMLGRFNDPIKGAKYAVMAMSYIVKEVPDARLNIISSDSRIQFLKNLTKELNLTNNVFIHSHTYDISQLFWNSSVHMYTSLSEAFPMAMNEGKAHGLPIVAFDVPYSNPYQDGVTVVDLLDVKALANETIKLLKDYNYRKKMGENAKKSLDKFSNKETVELWERLFRSLLRPDKSKYRELQKEIEKKYYNEESAKIHFEKHFQGLLRYNSSLYCHYLDEFSDPQKVKFIKECNSTENHI